MTGHDKARYWIQKRAQCRTKDYPLATLSYYGPTDQQASKVVVGIFVADKKMTEMRKWYLENDDLRFDHDINQEIVTFLSEHRVESIAMVDRIIGCPHEEGIDYPEGKKCPDCPFWHSRDRWTGERIL